jgi:hypothetical protein
VLRASGVRTIVLQFSGDEHGGYDARHPDTLPVRSLLRAAATLHMDVYVGLYADPRWPEQFDVAKHLAPPLDDEAGRAYLGELSRASEAFAGFYIPEEIDEQTWDTPERAPLLAAFLERSASALRSLRPDKPVTISPFYAEKSSPEQYARFWSQLLAQRSVDILMLQDGAGARGTSATRIARTLKALRAALDPLHIELWAVVELFRQTGGPPVNEQEFAAVPDELARICASIAAERPLVHRLIAFSVLDYMHPARGDKHKHLYDKYRAATK